jgi:23S rRNA pseudouridine1911/1915/1917 synthase
VRLDQEVSRRFSLSRRAARDAVRRGRVDVDGTTVSEPGLAVPPGAAIELHANRPVRRAVRTRLAVLHEDEDVLIVDKPAGLLTVPTEAREKDTLWTRAIHYLQHRYGGRPYAGIVHRLDRDTSGALVFARSRGALHALQDLFRRHAIDREYVALVEGSLPDRGTFDRDLVRTPGLRRSVAKAGEEGKRAVTRFETIERLPRATCVSVRPETGRTHQIRVHFAASGHPILGDRVYGPALRGAGPEGPARQLLHARRLGFQHPRSGEAVSVESPLPHDFREALAALRHQSPRTRAEAEAAHSARPHRDAPDKPHRKTPRASHRDAPNASHRDAPHASHRDAPHASHRDARTRLTETPRTRLTDAKKKRRRSRRFRNRDGG